MYKKGFLFFALVLVTAMALTGISCGPTPVDNETEETTTNTPVKGRAIEDLPSENDGQSPASPPVAKNESEANQVPEYAVEITPVDLLEQHYLVLRSRLPLDNMTGFMAIEGQNLRLAAQRAGIEPQGNLSMLFYEWDTENGIGEAAVALPVAATVELPGYVNISLPAGPAIGTAMQGPYSQLGVYHYAMDAYLKANNLSAATPTIEEYVIGPTATPDTNLFVTMITYPLVKE
ncbi:MAG: hypothetical protein AAF433_23130 [Bacteroidota bacterium]